MLPGYLLCDILAVLKYDLSALIQFLEHLLHGIVLSISDDLMYDRILDLIAIEGDVFPLSLGTYNRDNILLKIYKGESRGSFTNLMCTRGDRVI